jgi:hypothetical protein
LALAASIGLGLAVGVGFVLPTWHCNVTNEENE